MGDKDQVVVEVIRDESPLAPAPSSQTAAANLDAMIEVMKAKNAPAEVAKPRLAGPAPASDFVAPAVVSTPAPAPASEFAAPAEIVLDLCTDPANGAATSELTGDTPEAPSDMLDLGFTDEETDADLDPMLNVASIRARLAAEADGGGAEEDAEHTEAAGAPIPLEAEEAESTEAAGAPIPLEAEEAESTEAAGAPIPVRPEQPEDTQEAGAPIPVRPEQPEDTQAPGAAIPVRPEQPEALSGGVAPVADAGPGEYTGDGAIVEYESDAQREAREEEERRHAARLLAEEQERQAAKAEAEAVAAAIAAKAAAELEAIKAARAEMDAKKKKREEARAARKGGRTADDAQLKGDGGGLAKNVQERVRNLTAAEQQKLARTGDQRERVVLERIYGKNVWDALLRNPKLTPPEAGRIARMGALPVPLLELIVSNRAWLSAPQVRRALLTNPRLKNEMLITVLRATPKSELKLMPKQMSYPAAVRQMAKKLLRY